MALTAPIRWGILGCGDVTEKKSGPAFSIPGRSEVLAVMRRTASLAEDYAQRHQVPRWYSRAEDLIADPDVDAVYIATPPGSHHELALQVAAAGKPCYVEKPMARTARECEDMNRAFAGKNLPLAVAYYRRALPHFTRIKKGIDAGEWGRVLEVNTRYANGAQRDPSVLSQWRYQPEISGGGLLWDLGSHLLDLLDFWLGALGEVQGICLNLSGQGKVEEVVSCSGIFPGGIPYTGSWNFISPVREDRITLICERAVIEASCFGSGDLQIHTADGTPSSESAGLPDSIQTPLIANVVDAFLGEGTLLSSGETALRTNRVLDRIAGYRT